LKQVKKYLQIMVNGPSYRDLSGVVISTSVDENIY